MNIEQYVPTNAVRVFFGKKLPRLTRERFLAELGTTFMPGTPYMLAPLGLAAYLSAAFDITVDEKNNNGDLPDEAALIVYASQAMYDAARNTSLRGRMYAHSHSGVFDMDTSKAQWAGPAPDGLRSSDGQRVAWYAFERDIDWQANISRVLLLQTKVISADFPDLVREMTLKWCQSPAVANIVQSIGVATASFAIVWLHCSEPNELDLAPLLSLLPDVLLVRDLITQPVIMRTMEEAITIDKPAAYTFRFVRDLRYFI